MSKVALLTGITGQDGSYLAELLLSKGYEVHGIRRRSSSFNTGRIDHLYKDPHESATNLYLRYGDITDSSSIHNIIAEVRPDEIYNLAAQSHVAVSFESPEYTANCDALGPLRILQSVKSLSLDKCKIYQASTSELYGGIYKDPQDEITPFNPKSPYAIAKQYAYWITVNYREAYGMFACNGILFNHESPRRGETFVTRKITRGLCKIQNNTKQKLYLGNLDAKRDWGHAKDYVKAMWLILQQKQADDYVIATGNQLSVREFIQSCAIKLGWKGIAWKGEGKNEVGIRMDTGDEIIKIDPIYYRPCEVHSLQGNSEKAKRKLGWEPKITIEELIDEMLEEDLKIT